MEIEEIKLKLIEKLKTLNTGEKDIEFWDDDLKDDIEDKLKYIYENDTILARVFLIFYSVFEKNIKNLDCKELKKYLNDIKDIDYLRNLLREYGDGNNFGDHHFKHKIHRYVDNNRENCIDIINLGKEVFINQSL